MDPTLEKLKEVFQASMPGTDVGSITRETSLLNDLGMDSLSMMLSAMLIEDTFHIRFGDQFSPGTVGELCEWIEKEQDQSTKKTE